MFYFNFTIHCCVKVHWFSITFFPTGVTGHTAKPSFVEFLVLISSFGFWGKSGTEVQDYLKEISGF